MEIKESFFVEETQENLRLDILLTNFFTGYSRTYFQFLIENEKVLLNGKPVKKKDKANINDQIEVFFLQTPEISLEPQNIPLDILYEDEHILAINKPSGMVVHPAVGHYQNTFVNALIFHCKNLKENFEKDTVRPGIVHRLDKDTSGILIAAKNDFAHRKLVDMFASRDLKKIYLAICLGNPKQGLIDIPIGRHPQDRKQMQAAPNQRKNAITEVINTQPINNELSLLELHPLTGRTHQLRVHLKYINCPILGDQLYGSPKINQKYEAPRQYLHAKSLEFLHPITKENLKIEAPLPIDIKNFIYTS